MREVVVVAGARTAIGDYGMSLKDVKTDGIAGIEYSRKESDGTTAMYRVYRSAAQSRLRTKPRRSACRSTDGSPPERRS